MPPFDGSPSRTAVASNALLTAAISGLLCFTTSCKPPTGDTPDARTMDTGAVTDNGAQPDTAVTTEAGNDATSPDVFDSGNIADSGELPDAAMMDTGTVLDVTVDTGMEDASDSGVVIPPCDVNPMRSITSTMVIPGITLAAFTAECNTMGGHIEIHPHCGGANTCAGRSYDEGTSTLTEHSCQGLNTCNGFSCIIP